MNHLTSSLSLVTLVALVLGPWSSIGLVTELFPMEEGILLPLDYCNTTGVIDLDHSVSIGGQEYIAMEVSASILS